VIFDRIDHKKQFSVKKNMCGIAGIISFGTELKIQKTMLERMIEVIDHRGPDGKGFYLDEMVGLGHCRLSILDIAHGQQPMSNEDGRIWISYNGEMYNYMDHRAGLEALGHRFKTRCDTEIILHLYEEYGDSCVDVLNGIFAFAIWDVPRQRLLLARDRMGVKPLCYARVDGGLLFGSEAKALFASGLIKPSLDIRSVDNFFSFTYPLQPRSMFKGVYKVLPAEQVVIEHGQVSTHRYWTLRFEEPKHSRLTSDYTEEFLSLLRASVKRQLMSDGPVGAYLSGGIDSTMIVALMKNLSHSAVETFSIGFDDQRYDESSTFKSSAKFLEIKNHCMQATPSLAWSYPRVLWHLEMPFRHPISIPYFHLSRFVRERGVKVVLTGEGSDELFGSYAVFVENKFSRILLPFKWMPGINAFLRALWRRRGQPVESIDDFLQVHIRLRKALQERYGCLPPWYSQWKMLNPLLPTIYAPAVQEELASADVEEELIAMDKSPMKGAHPHNASLWLESQMRLPNWILLINDHCSMANGIESRVPYLDHELVEYVARLPVSLKLHWFNTKYILREASRGLIPEELVKRHKFPFQAPIWSWFFSNGSPGFVEEVLSENSIRQTGIFDPDGVIEARKRLAASKPGTYERLTLEYLVFGILGIQILSEIMKSSAFSDL
jgi:asparagine synthase (glutamine-hydrolysing)